MGEPRVNPSRGALHLSLCLAAMIFSSAGIPAEVLRTPPSLRPCRRRRASAEDSPARRLDELGPRALAVRELLGLLVDPGRGWEQADRAVRELLSGLSVADGGCQLRALAAASPAEIARAAGIGPGSAARVVAAFELGRRAACEWAVDRDRFRTARDVYDCMKLLLRDLAQEELHVLLLDTQYQLISDVMVTRGTVDTTLAHPREVFRPAIRDSATAVVLVHNHPSGEPAPSAVDKALTRKIAEAGRMLGIPLVDHVIVGEHRYHSFLEERTLRGVHLGGFG